jgi:secreted trypsin-like serine protease
MRRRVSGMVMLVFFMAVAPAQAITNGAPDGDRHPEVGALLAQAAHPDGTWAECSGTLIAPRVFLTAAHCDEGVSRVAVSFDSAYRSPSSTIYWGTWHADPAYSQRQSDPHDLAVVVLDQPVQGINPASLPAANSLTDLAHGAKVTSAGYGATAVTRGAGGLGLTYLDTRYTSVGSLDALTPSWLRVSQNVATGDGGTCYGDSGGPNFLGAGSIETTTIAAITITGDTVCQATNVDYRLDTPSARAFLRNHVELP